MSFPDVSNAPDIIKQYYASGIYVPERYWKIVAAGTPWFEVIDGDIVNLDQFNATH